MCTCVCVCVFVLARGHNDNNNNDDNDITDNRTNERTDGRIDGINKISKNNMERNEQTRTNDQIDNQKKIFSLVSRLFVFVSACACRRISFFGQLNSRGCTTTTTTTTTQHALLIPIK